MQISTHTYTREPHANYQALRTPTSPSHVGATVSNSRDAGHPVSQIHTTATAILQKEIGVEC